MRSLATRFGIGLTLGLTAVFTIQWWVMALAIYHVAENYTAERLRHDADALVAAITIAEDGPHILDARTGPIYQQPFSGHYYRVQTGEHVLRSRSLWDQDITPPATASGSESLAELIGPQAQRLLVLTRAISINQTTVSISVAEDMTAFAADLRAFNIRYGLFSGTALVALLLIQAAVLRLGLRPLGALRDNVTQLEHGEAEALHAPAPREIEPLVSAFNRLQSVLRERLARSRRAAGNLAHALKTPLSRLTDLTDDPSLRDQPTLRTSLVAQVDRIRGLIDRELKRARLAGGAIVTTRSDLPRELAALVDTLHAIYRDKSLTIDYHLSGPAYWPIDREDFLELAGNLLDNACKWAAAKVHVDITTGDDLALVVEDDGPGVAANERTRLAERGTRLDESAGGHGLGLAIAGDVAASYGGTLAFERSGALGGLRVDVRLPRRPLAKS